MKSEDKDDTVSVDLNTAAYIAKANFDRVEQRLLEEVTSFTRIERVALREAYEDEYPVTANKPCHQLMRMLHEGQIATSISTAKDENDADVVCICNLKIDGNREAGVVFEFHPFSGKLVNVYIDEE